MKRRNLRTIPVLSVQRGVRSRGSVSDGSTARRCTIRGEDMNFRLGMSFTGIRAWKDASVSNRFKQVPRENIRGDIQIVTPPKWQDWIYYTTDTKLGCVMCRLFKDFRRQIMVPEPVGVVAPFAGRSRALEMQNVHKYGNAADATEEIFLPPPPQVHPGLTHGFWQQFHSSFYSGENVQKWISARSWMVWSRRPWWVCRLQIFPHRFPSRFIYRANLKLM